MYTPLLFTTTREINYTTLLNATSSHFKVLMHTFTTHTILYSRRTDMPFRTNDLIIPFMDDVADESKLEETKEENNKNK